MKQISKHHKSWAFFLATLMLLFSTSCYKTITAPRKIGEVPVDTSGTQTVNKYNIRKLKNRVESPSLLRNQVYVINKEFEIEKSWKIVKAVVDKHGITGTFLPLQKEMAQKHLTNLKKRKLNK